MPSFIEPETPVDGILYIVKLSRPLRKEPHITVSQERAQRRNVGTRRRGKGEEREIEKAKNEDCQEVCGVCQ